MKFDMGAAWNEAVRLIAANRQVITIVAGVFFFLPSLAWALVFAKRIAPIEAAQVGNPDPSETFSAMVSVFSDLWWLMLLTTVIQWLGVLGMLVLLSDRGRPTVGEALGTGAKLLLPYFGVQILMSCIFGIVLLFPFAAGASAGAGAAVLTGVAAAVVLAFLFTKFLLVSPIMAAERAGNPVAVISRSWALAKGNSLRLFAFVFLIAVAFIVVTTVASLIAGLVFALAGDQVAEVGDAIVSSLVGAAFMVVFVAVLAAIYRQLAGTSAETVRETFD